MDKSQQRSSATFATFSSNERKNLDVFSQCAVHGLRVTPRSTAISTTVQSRAVACLSNELDLPG